MGRISMPQGKGSQLHNRREYEKIGKPIPDNIDTSKSHENITLIDRDIRQAYGEIYGEALEAYNGKQKRADRRIEDYYEHIKKSKNGEKLFYEDVLQWGKKEDFQKPETRERAKEALVKYVEGFEKRNPNLKLIGAYIHMDEASPHLHIDYVPVAHGYSRGLEARNSLDKAMKQMGFVPDNENRKNNATKLWKEGERAVFGEICRGMGLEVEPERKSNRKSLTVDEYKAARDEMLGEIEQELKDLETAKQAAAASVDKYTAQILRAKEVLEKVRITLDKGEANKKSMEQEKIALAGDLRSLRAEKETIQEDVATLQTMLQNKTDELVQQRGGHMTEADVAAEIAAHRAAREREARQKDMEAFVQLPDVAPVFKQWQAARSGKKKMLSQSQDKGR